MSTIFTRAWQALAGSFTEWRRRQRAYAELAGLDDRSLADIGITRSDIPYILLTQPAKGGAAPGAQAGGRDLKHAA